MKLLHAHMISSCIIFTFFCNTMTMGMNQFTAYQLIKKYTPTTLLLEGPKKVPIKVINRIIIESLKTKNNDIFHYDRYAGPIHYEDQTLFRYRTRFAKSEINSAEELYASYGTQKQQEFVEVFSRAIKILNHLKESRASEKTIEDMVDHYYNKLTPLVWRVHLLWFMRQKTTDIFEEVLQEMLKCAPCSKKAVQATCSLSLALWYYYNILFVMPWPSQGSALFYATPAFYLISFYYDIIKKSVTDYADAKKFIHEKLERRDMWRKITDKLAQKMEQTYQPL